MLVNASWLKQKAVQRDKNVYKCCATSQFTINNAACLDDLKIKSKIFVVKQYHGNVVELKDQSEGSAEKSDTSLMRFPIIDFSGPSQMI